MFSFSLSLSFSPSLSLFLNFPPTYSCALCCFQADNNVFHMAYILSNSRNIESTNILQWAHGIELNGQEKTTTEEEESENANGEEAGGIEFMKEPPPKLVLPVSSFLVHLNCLFYAMILKSRFLALILF